MNADKPYFAIGFPNMAGGYEVRNRYFKGCVAPKDITHIRQQDGQRCMCYLFEGFMDYLSFLTIRVRNNPQHPRLDTQDYVILNSVSNLAKAESLLETYTQIGCFLDNDTAGRSTCKKLKEKFGEHGRRCARQAADDCCAARPRGTAWLWRLRSGRGARGLTDKTRWGGLLLWS